MNKTIIATAIAALLVSGTAAIAQDAGVGVGAGAGVTVDTPAGGADAGANANANAKGSANSNAGGMSDQTYGSVISSISGSSDVDLSTATDESKVTIVLLSSLQGDAAAEASALDQALSANTDSLTTLRSNIDANTAIKAKLEADGHTSADVVAVKSNADGTVIVYVDDRS